MSNLPFRFNVAPPLKPGEARELERLIVETRKMLDRVYRKCKRNDIQGYDQTEDWMHDLLDVADKFYGLTCDDVLTVVEAVQDIRNLSFPEFTSAVWRGIDTQTCTKILNVLCAVKSPIRARQRLEGKPGYRQWVIEVHPHHIETARAMYEEFVAAERRSIGV